MKRLQIRAILLITLLITTTTFGKDTITPTQPLANNETLVSSNGQYTLGFFTPAGSNNCYLGLWYSKIATQTILWVANRDKPVTNSTGILSITSKGSLTITDSNSTAVVWSAGSTGLTNPVAQLLDTGNLVVREDGGSGSYAWQGFHHPTDTMLPGMKVGVFRTSGLNVSMTSWKSDDDPSPGSYTTFMDPRGDPELFLYSTAAGSANKVWRSGAWNGVELSGSPSSSSFQGFVFSFVNNDQEVTYSYEVANNSIVSRLVINRTGVLRRTVWLGDTNQWTNDFWYAPKDQCDSYGLCGPYGACDPNRSPVCKCLLEPAFTPENPANWQLRDGKDGCIRRTPLNCIGGTDGFNKVINVKLPESANSTVDMSLSLDQCRAGCLSNCACTAYASARQDGSGCVIWVSALVDIRLYVDGGQDLFVRVAAADVVIDVAVTTPEQSHKSKSSKLAIVLSLILGVLLLAFISCFVWRRKKRSKVMLGATASFNDASNGGAGENDLDLPLFDFGTIAASTNHFSEESKLGEGGFGPVYKGKLEDTQDIAVKRLARTSVQGREEFKNEMVLIAKLQHRNLVRLLGCCIQGEERMLIYEYMPNRSLDAFLFDKEKVALLDWQTRYRIILGVTRGLLYLHQDSRFRIIHRDLKASNILLDKDMNPKISDFGMARIFGGDETDFNTRKVVGTYGYMSPEYAMDGIFSVKSDVFSYGVLVLEIVSGKKNRGVYSNSSHVNLLSHAWSLWKEGKSIQLVDESIGYSFSMDEAIRCIKLGLLCVQERPEDRPLMSSVVQMLFSDIALMPHPKQPGFAARRGPFEAESSSNKKDPSDVNDITISMLEGR
ncbi:receptor-like serine/threonine-protein kinase SD1-8 [Iris pallida]|uniref:Receptor-like serine/threonine-protein kinase n=1 Tax=Iris pallida TaxID=29817 RepID=A0AAX6HNG8_IRIPA|nr:receptor-like serine/threonine-protein kinase SD1-8 [Iris pallida]KAJ6843609.1 receptor-like serine/threonine-protein kinase SD1-8 [Iris pallida]